MQRLRAFRPSAYLLILGVLLVGVAVTEGSRVSLVWETQTVASGLGTYGGFSSLALDTAGHPQIAYRDGVAGTVRYAYHDGTAWHTSTVDSAEVWSISLALDTADHPRLCYRGQGALRYADYDGTTWHPQTVESGGDTGWDCSLALDAAGRPAIAYFHHDYDDLKYARYNGTSWQVETVDTGGDVGRWASLALDAAGQPHIAYLDYTSDNLKYAYRDGAGWHIQVVDSAGSVGFDVSLALDAAGRPHVSYRDATNHSLKYALYDGAIWQVETVESAAGDTGKFTSLALDAAGYPRISYYDWTSATLRYAFYDGASWQTETVDGIQPGSYMTSLAVDAAGRPHISYSDVTDGALKYAVGESPIPPTPTPAPCYWGSFPFGVDSWITAAPPEYTVATFAYGGQTRPAVVAVPYGAGRSVFAPGSLFSQIGNLAGPGNVKHSIFLNSVAWVTSGSPPAQTHVLVTWGHRELVTYHQGWQCCSANVVQALADAGYDVDTSFDVPSSLEGYDAVVMPGVGWWADPGYPNPPWWSGSSGHALTSAEIATLLSFVQGGGGLVTSVEWNLGAAWMNPVASPMGVTLAAISNASPLTGVRVLDHPVMEQPCSPPPTLTPPPPPASPTLTPPPPPPTVTPPPPPPTDTPTPPPPTATPTLTPPPPPPTDTPAPPPPTATPTLTPPPPPPTDTPVPPTPPPVPCYWDSFGFGVDSWITAAPAQYTVATFAYGGQTRPALVAAPYGTGRSVFAPGSLFSEMGNLVSPGNVNHRIFLNSVAWVTSGSPPAQTHVLVTWGHRELVTYHRGGQCCSANVVQALADAGYNVDTAFDVPSSLDGYDAVVMPGVGWWSTPGYPNPRWWSGSSGHALTSGEVAALLSFVQNGGGLVTSVEWNLGAAWMNPVANPMGVTLSAISNFTPLRGIRVLDHPVMERPCSPPPTVTPPPPPPTPTLTPPPPPPTDTPVPPTVTPPPPPPTDTPIPPTATPIPPTATAIPPTATPPPPPACELYPIALHIDTVRDALPGQEIPDILNGMGPGNFGWLTWTGDQSVGALVRSLTPPGDSYSYSNPFDPADHTVSIGDWVRGRPGVADGRAVRQALDNLKPLTVKVPVWDSAAGSGANARYRVVGFAQVQVTDYYLPLRNRISVIFWGFASCESVAKAVR